MEFAILGPLTVRSRAGVVALGGDKRRALLALLLLHANEPMSAERLAVALWGDDTPVGAVKTVRVHVSRLRASLGQPDVLVTTPAGYCLRVGEGELDAERFERLLEQGRRELADGVVEQAAATLRTALSLWRGPALADLRYEPFAQSAIRRLEELRWDAIEARNAADLELGRVDAVLADIEGPTGDAPVRERLVEQRMQALYRAGRQVEALAVYRDAGRRLHDELGLEPGPALRELEHAILMHDRGLSQMLEPPPPPTRTVGRQRELDALAQLLDESRLLTLTGPGGVGKTRVAVEGARALAGRYADGVRVAWLAGVVNPDDVAPTLARAVGALPQANERPEDALARRLSGADLLLLVDNVEHVMPAAPLLSDLVAACPHVRVLATSREPLRLRGERCLPVAPLDESDAITLFVDRARDRRPDFGLTDANAPAVAEACRRLDGLPLALELAAGRIGLLGPQQLVSRLADALPLLEGGGRDAPARQRTMRATLEWSVALLDEPERRAFRALAVFVGGGELDAVETVTQAPLAVLDALVAKSLVREQAGRLSQLEVVRQFATAELHDSSQRGAVERRHAEHYLRLAERLGPDVRIKGRGPALLQLERELGNLRAALDYWIAQGDGNRALRLAAALEPWWSSTNHFQEGVAALRASLALEAAASERTRGRARVALSLLQRRLNPRDSRMAAEDSVALARASGDLEGECMALDALAYQTAFDGEFAEAGRLARQSQAVAERLGDPYHLGMALLRQTMMDPTARLPAVRALAQQAEALLRRCGAMHRIAELMTHVVMSALDNEDYEAANELAADGLRAAEAAGSLFEIQCALGNAGLAALFLEQVDAAERHFLRQLTICRRERLEGRWGEPALGLAIVAATAGDYERAATLAGACEATMRESVADADRAIFDRLIDRFIAPARSALGDAAWTRAAAAGAALTRERMYELALEEARGAAVPGSRGRVL